MFSMNIVSVDFFITKPIAHFDPVHSHVRNLVVQKVPVIRMFGNTEEGKKACVFVHGVFPYLYIPFSEEHVSESVLQQLANAIDKALNVALGYKDSVYHVFEIVATKKIPMYGYHEKEQTFLKIFLFEPYHISKLEDLLLSGAILNERFQPHESHIPYVLQFCMDFNLYGMNYVKLTHLKFRNGTENSLPKLSFCEVEGDAKVECILTDLSATLNSELKNPGLRAIWKDEEERRKRLGKSCAITPQSSQTRQAPLYNTEKIFKEKLRKNIGSCRRQNVNSSRHSSLDDTFMGDEMNCTIDAMILDQLNVLAENDVREVAVDQDSILGTQILHDDEEEDYKDAGENWTDELKPIITEESFYDLDATLVTGETSNSPPEGNLSPAQHNASQDIFEEDVTEAGPSHVKDASLSNVVHKPGTPNSDTNTFESVKSFPGIDLVVSENSNDSLLFSDESKHESPSSNSSDLLEKQIVLSKHNLSDVSCVIRPINKPISKKAIVEELIRKEVINIASKEAFYSNISDIGSSEISNSSLHLEDAPIQFLEEYQSRTGLLQWRKKVAREISGDISKSVTDVMKSYQTIFDTSRIIKPFRKPPTCKDIIRWIKCKEVLKKNNETTKFESEKSSMPIKELASPENSQKGVLKLDCFQGSESSQDELDETFVRNDENLTKPKRLSFESDMFPSSPSSESLEASSTSHKDSTSNDSIHKDLLKSFIRRQLVSPKQRISDSYAVDAMTPDNTGDFQMGLENLNQVGSKVENYYLTVLAIEIHAISRALLKPDPQCDEVKAIFYYLYTCPPEESRLVGVILIDEEEELPELKSKSVDVTCVTAEKELFTVFIEKVRLWDPDILIGYEIETLSWGYLLERGYILDLNLNQKLSRIQESEKNNYRDEFQSSELKIGGRIVINLWRLLRHEVALQSYTFENIVYHVLHERVPLHSFKELTSWWEHRTRLYKWMTVEHYLIRVNGVIRLLEQLDLIGRTSELARLFGIQFYEVLSRGSQFRVESMMLRLAHLNNFVALSPSVRQRANMRAPESLPLILEPESKMYTDPVIVLDFQSLYPSVIIAYNYCFSTCLGRVEYLAASENFPFGCVNFDIPLKSLKKIEQNVNISPAGIAFVNKTVRCGVLPRMLQEILDTRLMVKQSMKEYDKDNVALHRVLHARQLGLKLIANVTYGYTAANFSGRMPCVEVGDSVVSKGRETLQKAIETVNTTKKWNCRVVYGDTDSMFVLAPGRSRQEAFAIGKEIAEVVTNNNPTPVKLKFEKVYQPCILQTKKRYVGYMYEAADQKKAIYEAKGIETVRRDGCPAVTKILKKCLCILFETKDLSSVKQFVEKQFSKIISGRVSIQDLTFAKEYRGMAGYKPGACVPALSLARSWLSKDCRAEPRVGQRVPYVIIAGAPGLPLIKLVRSPYDLLEDLSLRLNAEYYISRVIIPPLERCFLLLGTPILPWYTNLPRKLFVYLPNVLAERRKRSTISQYFASVHCVCCNEITQNKKGVCNVCLARPQLLSTCLFYKVQSWQRSKALVDSVCASCVGRTTSVDCISLDCPVLYKHSQIKRDLNQLPYVLSLCEFHFDQK